MWKIPKEKKYEKYKKTVGWLQRFKSRIRISLWKFLIKMERFLRHYLNKNKRKVSQHLGKDARRLMLVSQLCPTLCYPMDCSPPGPSVHGIFQAGILEWVAITFSRGSFWPRAGTWISCIAGRFFSIWATRESWIKVIWRWVRRRLNEHRTYGLDDLHGPDHS